MPQTWADFPSVNWGLINQAGQTTGGDPTQGTWARLPDGTFQYFEPGQNPKAYLGDSIPGGSQWAVPGSDQANHLERLMKTGTNQAAIKIAALVAGGAALGNSLPAFDSAATGYGSGLASASDTAYGSTAATAGGESVAGSATAGAETIGNGLAAHPFLAGLNTALGAGGGSSMGMPGWANLAVSAVQGLLGKNAADRATSASTAADQAAIAEQQRQYNQTRTDMAPWLQAGQNALGKLQDPQANFTQSPGYNFVRSEGQRDIGNNFAARGGAASGNALRALTEFNQNLASGEYGNWWNQQAGLAGVGQTSANALGQLGQNNANNVGSLMSNQGSTRASGILGGNAAISNALGNGYSNYLYQQGQRRYPAPYSPYQGYGG